MALQEYNCINCEKKFKAGDWVCQTGHQHVVGKVRYYMDDAPTVADAQGRVRKGDSQTTVLNMPPQKYVMDHSGNSVMVPGGAITFVRGMYETSDPEIQYCLQGHKGLCSEERWKEVYLDTSEKMELKRIELAAREQRIIQQENELLAQTRRKGA